MRKISLLIAFLFTLMGGELMAQTYTVSDAPADGQWGATTHWYTIKNVQGKGYVSTNASYCTNGNLHLNNTTAPTTPEGYWCVVKDGDGVKFYNCLAGPSKVLGMTGTDANGRATLYDASSVGSDVTTTFYYVAAKIDSTEYNAFRNSSSSGGEYWNKRDGYLSYWANSNWDNANLVSGTGSSYEFTEVSGEDVTSALKTMYESYVSTVNTTATNFNSENLGKLFYYNQNQLNALKASIPTTTPSTDEGYRTAIVGMMAALEDVAMPEAGKYYALKNCNYSTYLTLPYQESQINDEDFLFTADAKLHGASELTHKNQVWTVEESDGKFYIKNAGTGKKLSGTVTRSGAFGYSDDGTAYTLYPNDGSRKGTAAIGHGPQFGKMHLDGSNNLVAWETAPASSWQFIEVSAEDYNKLADAYASVVLSWGTSLPVTNDAYTAALAAYNADKSETNLAALKAAVKACSYIRVKSKEECDDNTLGTSGTNAHANAWSESNAGLIWQVKPAINGTSLSGTKLYNLNTGKCLSTVPGGADATATMQTPANGAFYTFTSQSDGTFAIKDGTGGQMYCETNGNINKWHENARSLWYVTIATSLSADLATVGDKGYATVYLPFAVSKIEGATAYKGANNADATRVNMTEVSQLAAENGYVLVGEPNATATLTLSGEALTEDDNIITGTLTDITLTDDTRSQYRVFGRTSTDDNTTLGFNTPASSISTIPANKAFITETTGNTSAANLVLIFNGDTVDGIGAATIDAASNDNAPVYDLSGRRVSHAAKGLYIKGGKKILVK